MSKSLLIRTVKTAFAAILSIIVAEQLALDFAAAAGIIAILNIFETRRATKEGALKRAISAMIALLIGGFLFETLGYNTWVFGLYLLIFVPLSFFQQIELGLGPSSVLVTHLIAFGQVTLPIILNELALVFIGTGFAMLTNFYAPNSQVKLTKLVDQIDQDMKEILNLFGRSLVEDLDVSVHEDKLKALRADISTAVELAVIETDNMIANSGEVLYSLHLRENEMALLEDMYYNLKSIPPEYSDGKYISEVLIRTSENLSKDGDIDGVKERIDYLKDHFHMMGLPQSHEDFAIRSAIFQVFRSLDQFINISTCIKNKCKPDVNF